MGTPVGSLQAVTVSPLQDDCVKECRAAVPFQVDFHDIAVGETFDIQLNGNLSTVRTLYFALNCLADGSSNPLSIFVDIPDTGFYTELDATELAEDNAFGYIPIIANPTSLIRIGKLKGAADVTRLGKFCILNYNVPPCLWFTAAGGVF